MQRPMLGLMLVVALLGAGYVQAGVLIDNFDTLQAEIERTTAGTTCSSVSGPGIIGGTRELCLTLAAGGSGLGATAQVTSLGAPFGGSVLNLNNNAGEDATVSVEYDDLGGVDLTAGGTKPWFIFRIQSMDHDLTVTVTLDDGTNVGVNTYEKLTPTSIEDCSPTGGPPCPEIVYPIGAGGDPGLPGNFYHSLEAFVSGGTDPVTGLPFGGHNPALDLTSIDRILVEFKTAGGEIELLSPCIYTGAAPSGATPPATSFGPGDGDDSLQCNLQIIPEPGTVFLLGTGLLGLGLVSMRKHFIRHRPRA